VQTPEPDGRNEPEINTASVLGSTTHATVCDLQPLKQELLEALQSEFSALQRSVQDMQHEASLLSKAVCTGFSQIMEGFTESKKVTASLGMVPSAVLHKQAESLVDAGESRADSTRSLEMATLLEDVRKEVSMLRAQTDLTRILEAVKDIGHTRQDAMVTSVADAVKTEVHTSTSAATAMLLKSLEEMRQGMVENKDISRTCLQAIVAPVVEGVQAGVRASTFSSPGKRLDARAEMQKSLHEICQAREEALITAVVDAVKAEAQKSTSATTAKQQELLGEMRKGMQAIVVPVVEAVRTEVQASTSASSRKLLDSFMEMQRNTQAIAAPVVEAVRAEVQALTSASSGKLLDSLAEAQRNMQDESRTRLDAIITPVVEAVRAEVNASTAANSRKVLDSLANIQSHLQEISTLKLDSVVDAGGSGLSEVGHHRGCSDMGASMEAFTKTVWMPRPEEAVDSVEPLEQTQLCAQFSRTLELQNLRTDLNEAHRQARRLENQLDHRLDDYDKFLEDLGRFSSRPVLTDAFDFSNATVVGRGHYGFVIACKRRTVPRSQVVVKVMSERWVRVAASEWAHGGEVGQHPHIVKHLQVLVHNDTKGEVRNCIQTAFASSSLPGKAPELYPAVYYAIVLELMENGTAWRLAEEGLLNVEGCGAIARQVASALAFLHRRKRTHNDVKPENILLQRSQGGGHLVAKLSDMGLVAHSVERGRDFDMFGYSVWCLILRRRFTNCPSGDAREAALAKLGCAAAVQRAGSLGAALVHMISGVWQGTTGFCEVEHMEELQGLEVALPAEEAVASQSK